MKKLEFKKDIHAPIEKVYNNMLGLEDRKTYEHWAAVFNPTSTYEGSWQKGSKIYFVGLDENGKKSGMISEVVENKPAEFVSLRHTGFLDGEVEITSGEECEAWIGGYENYSFHEKNGITTVTVELDAVEVYLDFFNKTYPLALEKLKEISES